MQKNILIFGGTGYLGKNLIKHLNLKKKFKIYSPPRKKCNLENFQSTKEYLKALKEKNYIVIFLAAKVRLKKDSNETYKSNKKMIFNFIKNLNLISYSKFIFLSSTDVYEISKKKILITEKTKLKSKFFYGKSKIYSENLIKKNISNRKCVIIRSPGIYGINSLSIINNFIKKLKKNENIYIQNDGLNYRDYISVKDLVKIISSIIDKNIRGTYNVSTGTSVMIKEILLIINRYIKKNHKVFFVNNKNIVPYDLFISNIKIKSKIKSLKFTKLRAGIYNIINNCA